MGVYRDDDTVNIPRADLINFRTLLAEIDESGGMSKLKATLELLNQPGVHDALESMVAKHVTDMAMAKLRAKWWKLVAWLAGIAVALTAFISSLDGALTAIRGWFR